MVAKGEGSGGGMEWEYGISRCKLLYVEWIDNKVLLYSPGNYIQYPGINQSGKEYEKEYIYIYIYIYTHTHTKLQDNVTDEHKCENPQQTLANQIQ